jgi:DNA-binding NarL/FixJ family response regulator
MVVADVRLYREGLASVLRREEHIEVIGAVAEPPEDLTELGHDQPDVILLDVAAPAALETVRALAAQIPEARVVALAVPELEHEVLACAEAGVAGFVTREQSIEDVVAVVEAVARGEMICSPRMAATLLRRVASLAAQAEREPEAQDERLTQRELEIVGLIERGLSNKQIARELSIQLATVKNHVHNILEKMHVNRRAEAAERLRARRAGRLPRLDASLEDLDLSRPGSRPSAKDDPVPELDRR